MPTLKLLMLVSGVIEILFSLSALIAPLAVMEAVGARLTENMEEYAE